MSCWRTTDARGSSAGRDLDPDRGARGPGGHHRHLRGHEGRRARSRRCRRDAAAPRAPAPARWIRAHEPDRGARPVEVELKYRVVDLAAAERYLAADEIGTFTGTAAPRSTQLEDRYVDTADGAMGRAGFAVRLRQTGRGTIVSVKSHRSDGGRRRVDAPRGARGPRRPDGRAARLARLGRAIAHPRAGRRRAAGRAGHDPAAPPQADRARRGHAGRAEPRRGRCRVALPRHRPVRRARGRAGQGRRGAAVRSGRRSSLPIRRWRPRPAASSRRRWLP